MKCYLSVLGSARRRWLVAAAFVTATVPAFALKFAAVEHHLKADPAIPRWTPGPVTVQPEEEFNLVGADIMDEITLGWAKLMREAYPRLSVTMEARASGSGVPALTAGIAHAAPVGREALPAEHDAFVKKFGYEPFAIRVATGSLGSLGKTATSIVLVAKDNPITGLTFSQLDAIYSTTRTRGHADITKWGDLGLTGEWADRAIHTYGLKPPNGIEQFFKWKVLQGGEWKPGIQNVKGQGFTHAFTVASNDMHTQLGGLTYALLANVTPDVRVVPLADVVGFFRSVAVDDATALLLARGRTVDPGAPIAAPAPGWDLPQAPQEILVRDDAGPAGCARTRRPRRTRHRLDARDRSELRH